MKKVLIPVILLIIVIAVAMKFLWYDCNNNTNVPIQHKVNNIQIDKELQTRIDSFVGNVRWVGTIGIMMYDATAQKTIYAFHEDSLMRPASCMKLLTCITALKTFGRSKKYHSRLYCSGRMSGDTLIGNLYVKLQYDPFFNRDSLVKLTDPLKKMGVKIVKGRVVMDMLDYRTMQHEMHWTMGDLKTRMLGLPFLGERRLRNEVLSALSRLGIAVRRDSIVCGRVDGRNNPHLVSDITTTLHQSLLRAMKNSSNINAECMLYPLGYSVSRKGNFRYNGTVKMQQFVCDELHMNPETSCIIHDGCGLCPDDRVTPRLLVSLLNYAYQHKYIFDEVIEDLPLSGTDGTLYDRLRKPSVIGKVKAKTGTLTREAGISTLSGYYKTKDGHIIIFAIMNNECPVMDGRWWQDKFLTKIVNGVDFPKDKKRD